MKSRRFTFVFALWCSWALGAFANGTTYTWTGKAPAPGNQDWSNVQNWSPSNSLPGPDDTVIIAPVNSSGFTVKVNSPVTVDSLTVITSILQGTGSLTVNTAMECQNAVLSPGGGIDVEGDFTVDPVPNIPAYNTTTLSCPMTIDGSGTITSNAVLEFGAAVSLENDGVFDVLAGSQLILLSGSGSSFINNRLFRASDGLARVSGGLSVFTNTPHGTVLAANDATLQIQGTLDDSGNFQTIGDGIIIVTAKTALHGDAAFFGTGTTSLLGTTTLDGSPVVSGNLQLGTNGVPVMTLNGTLNVDEGGVFTWYGGTLTGQDTNLTGEVFISQGGTMQINNLNGLTLRNTRIENFGNVAWYDSGSLFIGYAAAIDNLGSFYIFGDGSLVPLSSGSPGYGVAFFENEGDGTVEKVTGATNKATAIFIPFTEGTVVVEEGNLILHGGGTVGTWQVASNATIQMNAGNFSIATIQDSGVATGSGLIEGVSSAGAGTVIMNSGATFSMPAGLVNLTVAGGIFTQAGGSINTSGGLIIVNNGGNFNWNGGTINGPGVTISSSSFMNIGGGSSIKIIVDTTIVNEGAVNWTNDNSVGVINAGDDVIFINDGKFNIGCDSYFNDVSTNTNSRPVLNNEATGVITKAGTSGTATLGIELVNLGKIVPMQGNLELGIFNDGYLGVLADSAGTEMGGGEITFDEPTVIHEDVEGSGTIIAKHGLTFTDDEVDIYLITFFGDITNDGTFILLFGSPGDATFQNNFSQTANGRVVIPIRGTNAVTKDFGQLIVSGLNQAFLNGTLEMRIINGFAPPVGATFSLLTSFQRIGTFSKVNLPQGMQLNYTPGGATLVVTGAVPVQIISPVVTNGQFQFGFNTISNRSYTVQYKDDLGTGTWTFLTNFTADGSYWQASPLSPLVARRFYRVSNP